MERFVEYTFAPWPDGELLEKVIPFRMPGITRVEQKFNADPALLVEIGDMAYSAGGSTGRHLGEDGEWHADPNGAPGRVRLIWDGFDSTIFALECYDEFYSRPYAHAYAWKKNSERRFLHEIISEPDTWIMEILEDNPDTGMFPTGGQPVAALDSFLERNPSTGKPTGRFFPPDAQLSDSGTHPIFFKASGASLTPEDEAEIEQRRAEMLADLLAKPRYRHLFIASDTHMLEILCAGLPRWEWVE